MRTVKHLVRKSVEFQGFCTIVKRVDGDTDNFVHRNVSEVIHRRTDWLFRVLFFHPELKE